MDVLLYGKKRVRMHSDPMNENDDMFIIKSYDRLDCRCKKYGYPLEIRVYYAMSDTYIENYFVKLDIYPHYEDYQRWCKEVFGMDVTEENYKIMKKYCHDFRIVAIPNLKNLHDCIKQIAGSYLKECLEYHESLYTEDEF